MVNTSVATSCTKGQQDMKSWYNSLNLLCSCSLQARWVLDRMPELEYVVFCVQSEDEFTMRLCSISAAYTFLGLYFIDK
jgi:hypothetical protein